MSRKARWGKFGVDWFTVEAVNRIGKGGIRRGGCEYRFRVSALDKLRQSVTTDELDPISRKASHPVRLFDFEFSIFDLFSTACPPQSPPS
jgi:hypothetical protein